jgi:hypothetical protein
MLRGCTGWSTEVGSGRGEGPPPSPAYAALVPSRVTGDVTDVVT